MDRRSEFADVPDVDDPPRASLADVMADLAASDAEATAGELVDGKALLEEMRQAAADLPAKVAIRGA